MTCYDSVMTVSVMLCNNTTLRLGKYCLRALIDGLGGGGGLSATPELLGAAASGGKCKWILNSN